MLPIETVRTILPSVNIKSVILDNPDQINDSTSTAGSVFFSKSSQQLNIRVKTTSITNIKIKNKTTRRANDDQYFGSRNKIDFGQYLNVCIIQSRDADLTAVLQSMGDGIIKYIGPMNQWRGNDRFNDLIYSNVLKPKGATNPASVSSFKNSFLKIQTKNLFENIDSPLLEKTDDDGKQIKSVPLDFNFVVDQLNPVHLSYFVVPYLDLESLASEFNSLPSGFQLKDLDKISDIPTPLNYDTVFSDGRLSGDSFFYRMLNGKVWTGPVHRMPNGSYMTNNSHTSDSVALEVVQTKNIKIQDFRNRRGMMSIRVMNDFQDEEATVRNIINNLQPKNRSLNPNNNAKDPYISDLFLSLGSRKSSKFMFLVNMNDLLSSNSVFGKVIKTGRPSLRNKIFQNSTIKSLKIYRNVVKKVVGTNTLSGEAERFLQQNRSPVLIVDTFQKKGKSSVESTGNFVEEKNMSFSGTGIKAFNVVDRNFSSADRSQHQYELELEVVDGTLDYLRSEVEKLKNLVYALQNYESDILNSIIRPKETRDNPHTKDDARVFSRTRMIGGYDSRFGNLTPNFAIKMKNKYNGTVQTGVDSFIELLKIFSNDENFTPTQETNLKNFLSLITNSNITNPTHINSLIQLLQESIAKISSFIGQNVRNTDPVEKKSNYVAGFGESVFATHGAIKIKKKFNNIADLSKQGNGAYDYLSINTGASSQDSSNQVGLRTMGGRQYRERVVREILKYFTTTQPNLTEGMTGAGIKYAGGDSAQTTAFSFFSPSVIRFNEMPIDILNSGRIENSVLMKFIESKLVLARTQSDTNGEIAVYDNEFRQNSFLASRGSTRTQQIAPQEQRSYLSDHYNFIPTSPKLVPLSENYNRGASAPGLAAASAASLSAVPDSPSLYPSSFIEKIFKRTLDKSQISEDKNIDLFDLNQQENYLRGVEQFQVANLPNQIKALFVSISTGNGGDVIFRPQIRRDVFEDPDNAASATLKYKLLTEVQYLDSFFSTSMSNNKRLLMTSPNFKRLTADAFSKFTGKKILCRLRKFEIPQWGFIRPPLLDTLIYDEYFVIVPDAPQVGANPTQTPGSFVGDQTSELLAAQGWGLSEEEYVLLSEFGTSFLPNSNASLQSDTMQNLSARLGEFQDAVFANPVVDRFNTNLNSAGGLASSNMEATRPTSLGNIPKLRSELKAIRDTISALQLSISSRQKLLTEAMNRKQIFTTDLNKIPAAEMESEQAKSVRAIIGESDSLIDSYTLQNSTEKNSVQELKVKEGKILVEIREEMVRVQTSIIYKQVQSGVYGECATPSQLDDLVEQSILNAPGSGDGVGNMENIMSDLEEYNRKREEPKREDYEGQTQFQLAHYAWANNVEQVYDENGRYSWAPRASQESMSSTEKLHIEYNKMMASITANNEPADWAEWGFIRPQFEIPLAGAMHSFDKFQSYMSPGDAEEFAGLMDELRATVDLDGADIGTDISNGITMESGAFIMEAIEVCGGIKQPPPPPVPPVALEDAVDITARAMWVNDFVTRMGLTNQAVTMTADPGWMSEYYTDEMGNPGEVDSNAEVGEKIKFALATTSKEIINSLTDSGLLPSDRPQRYALVRQLTTTVLTEAAGLLGDVSALDLPDVAVEVTVQNR